MIKQYKISETKMFPSNQKINIHRILPIFIFLILPLGLGYYYLQAKPETWIVLFIYIGAVVPQIFVGYYNERRRKRALLKDYVITLDNKAITQKIPFISFLGFSFLSSKPLPTIKTINYKDITEIKKTGNGTLIIKAKAVDSLTILVIPIQIDNYKSLEKELAEIHPIISLDTNTAKGVFVIEKDGFKTYRNYFLSRIIPLTFIILLPFIAFFYFKINITNLEVIVIIVGFTCLLIFWGFSSILKGVQSRFDDYRLTIDNDLIIQEQKNGLNLLPISEITSINKSMEGIYYIFGKHKLFNTKLMEGPILIYTQVENKKVLEEKLNNIHPINYSRFLKRN